jgi:phage gp36-like protein
MAYIDRQDLIDELGENELVQLTDNDGTGEINEARLGKAIQYAQGVFESYIRSRYSLPVPSTDLVRGLNLDLAIFHLYKSRAVLDEGVYKIKKDAKDDAIKQLQAINKGMAALDIPEVEETPETPGTGDQVLTNANRALFTDEKLSSF